MTVEAVAHIRTVRNTFDNTVHLTELLNLQTTQTLCRCSINCIKITIFLFKLIYLLIDIFQNIQCKLSVLSDRFTIIKLLKLIQRCDAKGSCHRLQNLSNLLIRFQMSAIKTTLAICQWVGRSSHLSKIIIRTDMKITDHLKIEIQYLIEISALCSRFRKNHRKMKTYRTNVKSAYKYRHILVICRVHSATFIPWA